ncbi:MAG: hypothetical protein HKN87_14880 [Saprospiraceae bacterium]|nr:hypothetical protein [Saprospiraceae bacterium]
MSRIAKRWSICLVTILTLYASGLVKGQCPMDNAILGADEVCPGAQVVYSVTPDMDLSATYNWQLLSGGGQFVGATNGTSVTIDWQSQNGGPFTLRVTIELATCMRFFELDVDVADDFIRYPFNCFAEVNIPLDNNCEKLIEPQHLLTSGVPDCPGTYQVNLSIDGNIPIPNPVTIAYANQIITATISHPPSGRSCVTLVNLTDATEPTLICQNDTTICNDPYAWNPFFINDSIGFNRPGVLDNCQDDLIAQPDGYEWISLFNDPFFAAYVVRNWRAEDKYGNIGTCMDTIFLRRIVFDSIVCPPDTTIQCGDDNFDPSDPLTSGVPTFDGYPVYSEKSFCNIAIEYDDRIAYHCPGTYTIYRDWLLADLEAPVVTYDSCHQIIQVIDTIGPKIAFHDTIVKIESHPDLFGVNPDSTYKTVYFPTLDYTCLAHGYFPTPYVTDSCSSLDSIIVDISWNNGHINYMTGDKDVEHLKFDNLSQGKHIVTIKVRDACHNVTIDTLIAVAQDIKAPFITLDRYPVVTLGDFADVTWVDVSVFDEGTWDNCNLYAILARRVDWNTSCGYTEDTSVHSAVRTHYDTYWEWLQNDNELCFDSLYTIIERADKHHHDSIYYDTIPHWYGWSNQVPFCCADACSDEKVTLEIIAIDASCNISKLWVDVEVEDKSAPQVKIPLPDLNISCYAYNHYYRDSVEQGNFDVFGTYELFANTPYTYASGKTVIKDRLCGAYEEGSEHHYTYVTDTISNGLVLENCELVIDETQKIHFEHCGEGWIERQFVMRGACQSTKADSTKVIQRIYITNDCPLYESDIIWPMKDTTVRACGYVDLETEAPRMKYEDECREIGIHYKDEIVDQLYNADSTCLKIIRKWAVIDWCRQTAEFHDDWIGDQNYHYYEFDQIIYVINTEGPVMSNCDIDTLCMGPTCLATLDYTLEVTDDCTPADEIDISWSIYQKSENGYLPLGKGVSSHIKMEDLTAGPYKLIWVAEDGCGNRTQCSDHFDVVDCTKPSPICLGSTTMKLLPLDLDFDGQIDTAIGEIWAQELDVSSYDNCDQEVLDYRIRVHGTGENDALGNLLPPDSTEVKLALGCLDVGTLNVEFWVVDKWGNADFCQVVIKVQEPIEGCQGELGKVNGKVNSMNGGALADVSMELEGPNATWNAVTNNRGQYNFNTRLQQGEEYLLSARKEDDPIDGVSTLDLLKLSKHITGKTNFNSAFERIAADVNSDGRISVADLITIRKFILGKSEELNEGVSWRFFNAQMESTSVFNGQESSQKLWDFVGVKMGDINGDAGKLSRQKRSDLDEVLQLTFDDFTFEYGETVNVQFKVDEEIWLHGLQLNLLWDESTLQLVDKANYNLFGDLHANISNDGARMLAFSEDLQHCVYGQTIVELTFLTRSDGRLSNSIAIDNSTISSEAYPDENDRPLPIQLRSLDRNNSLQVGQNAPNPFSTRTAFEVLAPEHGAALLRIYQMDGSILLERDVQLTPGRQSIEINGSHFHSAGIYLYELHTPWGNRTKKLVFTGG